MVLTGPGKRKVKNYPAGKGWLLLAIGLLLPVTGQSADDKTKHFVVSALFGAGAETVLHYNTGLSDVPRVLTATALGTVPGLVKEIADSQESDNEFSQGDLLADVAGAFTGALLSNFVNRAIAIRVESDGTDKVGILISTDF